MADDTRIVMATIDNLDPPSGWLEGGNVVTIVGEGLGETDKVLFDDEAVDPDTVGGNGLLVRVKAPPHAAGSAEVRVRNREGIRSNPLPYLYE
jgi:IPT/TIG domain